MMLLSALLALAALALLGLSQPQHHGWWFRTPGDARRRRALWWTGAALLAFSFLAMLGACGPAIGAILWTGLLAPLAAVLVLARTYGSPR